jgi:hypothetical protein
MNTEIVMAVKAAALNHKIEYEALLAVIEAESAGVPFWDIGGQKKPPVRWEGHYFHQRLSGEKLDRAVKQGLASPKAGAVANPRNYTERYALIENAKKIDEQAALESVSWGLGQVMGAHWKHLGYKSVQAMVASANTVDGQIDMMVRFIVKHEKGLVALIKQHKWEDFAYYYNGPANKVVYGKKIRDLYNKYTKGSVSKVNRDAIIQMQQMLNKVGSYNLALDGIMGDTTKAAIRDFQMRNGLKVDGVYGPITQETLEAAYRKKVSDGDMAVAGTIVSGGGVGTAIMEGAKALEPLAGVSTFMQIAFLILILVGVFFTVKAFWGKK